MPPPFTRSPRAPQSKAGHTWLEHARGRPLMIDGAAFLASVEPRDDWLLPGLSLSLAPSPMKSVSWQREALHEHASVIAFLRLSGQLARLGAPRALVTEAFAAARDELRHARVAFTIASAFAGTPLGPAPFSLPPEPKSSRAELAAATYLDGCVAETVAAAILRESLAMLPANLARLMRPVVVDEERHAAFNWRLATWCVRDRAALAAIVRVAADVHVAEDEDDLPSYGVVGASERRGVAVFALERIVRPLTKTLLAGSSTSPRIPRPA